ncbi:MAG: MFS transporter [Micrococcales bacterium]|nr:MFS transporter [Micrococcales bacterium]
MKPISKSDQADARAKVAAVLAKDAGKGPGGGATSGDNKTPPPGQPGTPALLSHREILEVLTGLLIAMFVTNVSATVVGTALPVITAKLGSTQQQYTWIVTATLLASTASTPIWGKLADLFNKKTLMLFGLAIFIFGSVAAGASVSTAMLIACRAVQGIGMGAMMSLIQAIIGSVIPPLERGRYMAYTGATMAVATVAAPLIGGFIVDAPWLGWRWCFWSAVPFAVIAGGVLQFKLKVPFLARPGAKVDWLGATLVTAAVSALLIWISFANNSFDWISWQTAALLGFTLMATVLFVFVESKVRNPIIPLQIIKMRTTALAVVASVAVGIAMFGAAVFLGQYYQVARGYSPTASGLMMLPMMAGVLLASVVGGRLVSATGQWKPFTMVGTSTLVVGFCLMGTVNYTTPLWLIGLYGGVAGVGVGLSMQNLVLAVQNSTSVHDVGAASATVTFFRSLGGTIGVQVLGSVFASRVHSLTESRKAAAIAQLDPATRKALAAQAQSQAEGGAKQSLDFSTLPAPLREVIKSSYGDSIGLLFWIAAAVAVASVVAVLFMRATRLSATFNDSASADQMAAAKSDAKAAAKAGAAPGAESDAIPGDQSDAVPGVKPGAGSPGKPRA